MYINICIAFKYIPYWAAALSRLQLLALGYLHIGELAYTNRQFFVRTLCLNLNFFLKKILFTLLPQTNQFHFIRIDGIVTLTKQSN